MGEKIPEIDKKLVIELAKIIDDDEYGSSIHGLMHYFLLEFGKIPSSYAIEEYMDINKVIDDFKGDEKICSIHFSRKHYTNIILVDRELTMMIGIWMGSHDTDNDQKSNILITHLPAAFTEAQIYLNEFVTKYKLTRETDSLNTEIHFIINDANQFMLQAFKMVKPIIDIEVNYGKGFSDTHNKIVELLNLKRGGLILFHSVPGTGKSKYIQYLCDVLSPIKFVYLNVEVFGSFDSPTFMSFALTELKDAVLILEDCESLITSREVNKNNNIIPTLLNLTSGIFADILNCKVICTFNTKYKNIDDALLRKGRLLYSYEFRKLTTEEANILYHKLYNKDDEYFKEDTTLADVYNLEEVNFAKPTQLKIGFK